MTELRYLAPNSLDEAIGAFAAAGSAARILAGGTDLLVQMRSGVLKPGLIVDIKKIAEMTAIEETADGGFRIGAAASGMALAEHPRFGKVWPGVLEAVNLIGSKQVQGRASAGGNLCNGSPAGDSVPAMVAAGAIVTVQGPNGRRQLKVEDVPAAPGRTNLLPGEILVSFALPPRPKGSSDAYLRMIPRTEMDIAVVGVGVSLTLKDGVCTAARVGLGAVAPTVLLVEAAAKALIGSKLDDAALNAAAAALSAASSSWLPISAFAAASTRSTVGATAPSPTRAAVQTPSFRVRLTPRPTTAMSISVRGIMRKYASLEPGGRGGKVKLTRISPALMLVRPGPAGTCSTGISRRPFGPCTVTMAPAATIAGTLSPAGEPLQRLPPAEARPCTCLEPIRFTPSSTPGQTLPKRLCS